VVVVDVQRLAVRLGYVANRTTPALGRQEQVIVLKGDPVLPLLMTGTHALSEARLRSHPTLVLSVPLRVALLPCLGSLNGPASATWVGVVPRLPEPARKQSLHSFR
jgi:hypothetical protein